MLKKTRLITLLASLAILNGCAILSECNNEAPKLNWTQGPNEEVILDKESAAKLLNYIEDLESCEVF